MSKAVQSYLDSFNNLKNCAIYISADCNINCKSCFITARNWPKNQVISKELINKIFSYFEENYSINILGGEPFLYPETCKYICDKAKEINSFVRITTNGFWGENLDLVDYTINKIKPDILEFSYDEYHQEFISIEKLKNLIHKLYETNINIFIHYTMDTEKFFPSKEEIYSKKLEIINKLKLQGKYIYIFIEPLIKIGNAENNNIGTQKRFCDIGICTCSGLTLDFMGNLRTKCAENMYPTQHISCKEWNKNLLNEDLDIKKFYNNFNKKIIKQSLTIDSLLEGLL
jgi:organic radical activating enzyme